MNILIKPPQLRKTAADILNSSKKVSQCLKEVDEILRALDRERFSGSRADQLRNRYRANRERLMSAPELIARFSTQLDRIAREFEKKDKEMGTGSHGIGVDNPGFIDFIRPSFTLLFPYTIAEAIPSLQSELAGKDVLEAAVQNKITFIIDETGERLGYQGSDGTVVHIRMGDSIGGGQYSSSDQTITIDNGILSRSNSKEDLAEILAHEMQHAIDDKRFPASETVPFSDEEWDNFFNLPPEKQKEASDWLAQELTRKIDTEVRAYERSEAMENQTGYSDDGTQTREERQAVLDHRLDFSNDYESYYESSLAENSPGKEFDVWIDPRGNVHVDIKQPSVKDDGWWIF